MRMAGEKFGTDIAVLLTFAPARRRFSAIHQTKNRKLAFQMSRSAGGLNPLK